MPVWMLVGLAACGLTTHGQVPVEGIAERQVVADRVQIRVPALAGYAYEVTLDGLGIEPGAWREVADPDYHELVARRQPAGGGAWEERRVPFVVRSSERNDTEWGLPPWTPLPLVSGSRAELAAAAVRVWLPASVPLGTEVPVVVKLEGRGAMPLGPNATARLEWVGACGEEVLPVDFPLRRGIGSASLPTPCSGLRPVRISVGPRREERSILVETNSAWEIVGGPLAGATEWSAGSRLRVAATVTVPAGATLRIGPGVQILLEPGVDLVVEGAVWVEGTLEAPVLFAPAAGRDRPWGGFICRGVGSRLEAAHGFFVGSGADATWFDRNPGYDVHRREQALFLIDGAEVRLEDCAALDGHGQFGHGKAGRLTMERCLVHRFITGGEYNGGSVRVLHSALLEFPRDDDAFADADNDAIYFTTGQHEVQDSLIGWAKDDGVDAGSGGAGIVVAERTWVESCYHEAFAWSGTGRVATNRGCVAINSGQGVEAGFSGDTGSPDVNVLDCLVTRNLTGLRFGDNYDWTYSGRLRASGSLSLDNYRDVWGMNWADWTYRTNQMEVRGNWLTAADPWQPGNLVWTGEADALRLLPFLTSPPGTEVGVGFALRAGYLGMAAAARGVPVGLSAFTTNTVRVSFTLDTTAGAWRAGQLVFPPGRTLQRVTFTPAELEASGALRMRLHSPESAEITGTPAVYLVPTEPAELIPAGSVWRFLDGGVDPGATWTAIDAEDGAWKTGRGEFGFGDGDEATVVQGGPEGGRFAAVQFRHAFEVEDPAVFQELRVHVRRDDGALVYLNGIEVFRSNLPTGRVDRLTYTGATASDERAFYATNVDARLLRAGRNLLAVQVHQADASSSDLSFECVLEAKRWPRLLWAAFPDELLLWWSDAKLRLEAASSLVGPWEAVLGASSPVAIPQGTTCFYRLRQ